jgi:hypothetical protein
MRKTHLLLSTVAFATILVLAGQPAAAIDRVTANHQGPIDKGTFVGDGFADGREGGESFATATVIQNLPYSDSGGTCGHVQDVFLPCGSNAAPDVFYSYTPTYDTRVNVSLCGSGYDTALGIYDAAFNEIGCNDDFCGLQSEIDNVPLQAGRTYYIDVSGYGTNCGSYTLEVVEYSCCFIECPPGSLEEGEPLCGDGYIDSYNGGCGSDPTVFQLICPQGETNTAVMCGKSGTYLYQGVSYRDTDWFTVYGNNEVLAATVRAEFPVQLVFIYLADCAAMEIDWATGAPLVDVTVSRYVAAGVYVWIWVGPSVFSGIPCDSDYNLTLTGIGTGEGCEEVPVERTSWGSIKSLFK